MKILKIQKMTGSKYKIILDGNTIITYDNVVLSNNLLYKKDLSTDDIKKIEAESNYYEAYDKTLKYVTKKIRSKKEAIIYISKFNISDNDKKKIIVKLEELNFINDIVFCKAFINDKIYLSKYGKNKIRKMLIEEGIDEVIINTELDKVDNKEISFNLENILKRKIENNHKYSNFELKNKLLNTFIREGYSKSEIIKYLDKYQKEDNSILKKEFDKLYYKYKTKYDKELLIFKIKQKLIQKGFNIDEINELIQEKTEE